MANHALPTVANLYADVISVFNDKIADVAKGLDPATSTPTGVATNSIRWTSASNKWQKWNGTSWVDLTATYAISITGNAGTATTATTATTAATLTTPRAINGTNFNGSAPITTASWGTSRTITIGVTGKAVDGSANVSWTLAELGANVYKTVPSAGANLVSGEVYVATAGFTLPSGLVAGNSYVIYNNSASTILLTQGAGLTVRLAGSNTLTGNRQLLARGLANVWCLSTTEYIISGAGVL